MQNILTIFLNTIVKSHNKFQLLMPLFSSSCKYLLKMFYNSRKHSTAHKNIQLPTAPWNIQQLPKNSKQLMLEISWLNLKASWHGWEVEKSLTRIYRVTDYSFQHIVNPVDRSLDWNRFKVFFFVILNNVHGQFNKSLISNLNILTINWLKKLCNHR